MELFLALLPTILEVVGAVGAAIAGNSINASAQKEVNEQNLAYAQGMTEKTWERDDSSLQRQVQDAKNAGLSPLAVTGAMNSSSPLNYTAQAPQMDLSSLVGAFSSFDNMTGVLQERYKEKKADERLDKQLANNLDLLDKRIKADEQLQQSQFLQDSLQLGKQLTFQYNQLNEQASHDKEQLEADRIIEMSRQNQDLYSEICKSIGMSPKIEFVSSKDMDKYKTMLSDFMQFYNQWAKDSAHFSDDYSVSSQSTSDTAGMGSNVAGVAGVNMTDSNSESATYDYSDARMRKLYLEYLKNAVFPILIDDSEFEERSYEYKVAS